jgi:integrase/recombinase XerD
MSISMRVRAEDYLEMRRSLGFKLRGEGRMLAGFATRCDEQGQATITISAAWPGLPSRAMPLRRTGAGG